jgi:hypothetical protein
MIHDEFNTTLFIPDYHYARVPYQVSCKAGDPNDSSSDWCDTWCNGCRDTLLCNQLLDAVTSANATMLNVNITEILFKETNTLCDSYFVNTGTSVNVV